MYRNRYKRRHHREPVQHRSVRRTDPRSLPISQTRRSTLSSPYKSPGLKVRDNRNQLPNYGRIYKAVPSTNFNLLARPYTPSPVQIGNRPYKPSAPTKQTPCGARMERRKTLFVLKIAGKGLTRSPGSGGHYKRTDTSSITCKGK